MVLVSKMLTVKRLLVKGLTLFDMLCLQSLKCEVCELVPCYMRPRVVTMCFW